jgi:hypothetical protein
MLRHPVLLALFLFAFPVSGATAASLKLEVSDVSAWGAIQVDYRGTADVAGTVGIRVWDAAAGCPGAAAFDPAAPPAFWTDQPVGAGAFSAAVGGELDREGSFVVCGYLDQPGQATVTSAPVAAEYFKENGLLVYTSFPGELDATNRIALGFNASCRNAWGICTERAEGRVSVTLTPASRRKVGLRSGKILEGALKPSGRGTSSAPLAFSRAVKRKMDAAQTKAEGPSGFGRLRLKARVTFSMTAPLKREHSEIVTFGEGGTIRFSCATSMRKNQCTDGTYGRFLTGDDIRR